MLGEVDGVGVVPLRIRILPPTIADDEDLMLRCLGAAVVMQWSTLPTKLQRELFDNATAVGELTETAARRGMIARFLHKQN